MKNQRERDLLLLVLGGLVATRECPERMAEIIGSLSGKIDPQVCSLLSACVRGEWGSVYAALRRDYRIPDGGPLLTQAAREVATEDLSQRCSRFAAKVAYSRGLEVLDVVSEWDELRRLREVILGQEEANTDVTEAPGADSGEAVEEVVFEF